MSYTSYIVALEKAIHLHVLFCFFASVLPASAERTNIPLPPLPHCVPANSPEQQVYNQDFVTAKTKSWRQFHLKSIKASQRFVAVIADSHNLNQVMLV